LDHYYALFGAKYYVPLPFATLAIISDESVVKITTVNYWPQRRCRKLTFSVTTRNFRFVYDKNIYTSRTLLL